MKKKYLNRLTLVATSNLCGHFEDEVLGAYYEVSRRKRGWRSKGDTWCWNQEVMSCMIDANKVMCRNTTDENKNKYKSMKIKAKNAVLIEYSNVTVKGLTVDGISISEFCSQRIPSCGGCKENERCPNVFVRRLWIHGILLSEEDRKFLLCVLTESR